MVYSQNSPPTTGPIEQVLPLFSGPLYGNDMVNTSEVQLLWEGFPGAPGYTNLYCFDTDIAAMLTDVTSFVNDIKGLLPPIVTIRIPSAGNTFNAVTGSLVGSWTSGTGSTVTGTGSPGYSAPSGAVVNWFTGAIIPAWTDTKTPPKTHRAHRLRGKTFLVPLMGNAYDSDGSIGTTYLGTLATAANAMPLAGHLAVWHRPSSLTAADGILSVATSASVPDKAAVLTSRRQ